MVIIPMRKRKHNEGIHKDTIRDACPAGTGGASFYFIGNTVTHSCVKVEPSYEIKNAPRGCAARGKENIALRTACARRISQARFFFIARKIKK